MSVLQSLERQRWIYSPLGNIQGMFWSLEANCGRWSHSPQWFCASLILHWDLSCFTSRQVKSRLNLEQEGARGGPCPVVMSAWTSQEGSVHGQGCRGGQEKEALSWRLWVKRKFVAVKFRLWSEETAHSLSTRGSAGQDAGLEHLYYRDKGNSFLTRFEGAIPEVSLLRSSSHSSEQSPLLLGKARSMSCPLSPLCAVVRVSAFYSPMASSRPCLLAWERTHGDTTSLHVPLCFLALSPGFLGIYRGRSGMLYNFWTLTDLGESELF